MIRLLKFILALIVVFEITGCTSRADYSELQQNLSNVLTVETLKKVDSVVVLPSVGCGGCITNAMAYLVKNSDSLKNIAVVFTKITDRKAFRMAVPEDFLNNDLVHIDDSSRITVPEPFTIYPSVIYLNKGKIKELAIFDPGPVQ
jgi:hypothetical protein